MYICDNNNRYNRNINIYKVNTSFDQRTDYLSNYANFSKQQMTLNYNIIININPKINII